VYFNANFNVFFKLRKVHLLVSELYRQHDLSNTRRARMITKFRLITMPVKQDADVEMCGFFLLCHCFHVRYVFNFET